MSASALSRVMDQAQQAAENFQAPAVVTPQTTAVATGGAPRPSLDSVMDSAGISVDGYLSLKYEGISYGDVKGLFDEAIVSINVSDIVAITQVRATLGGNTVFFKSYDGVTTHDGSNFSAAVEAKRAQGAQIAGPYQTAEVPMTLLEDIVLFDKGKESARIPSGTKMGTTPPLTGVKYLSAFLKKLREQGLMAETVKVKLVHIPRTNANNNNWGVTDFQLLGVIEDEAE